MFSRVCGGNVFSISISEQVLFLRVGGKTLVILVYNTKKGSVSGEQRAGELEKTMQLARRLTFICSPIRELPLPKTLFEYLVPD